MSNKKTEALLAIIKQKRQYLNSTAGMGKNRPKWGDWLRKKRDLSLGGGTNTRQQISHLGKGDSAEIYKMSDVAKRAKRAKGAK